MRGFLLFHGVILLILFLGSDSRGLQHFFDPMDIGGFRLFYFLVLLAWFTFGLWTIGKKIVEIQMMAPYLFTRGARNRIQFIWLSLKAALYLALLCTVTFAILVVAELFVVNDLTAMLFSVVLTWIFWGSLFSCLVWAGVEYKNVLITLPFAFGAMQYLAYMVPNWPLPVFYARGIGNVLPHAVGFVFLLWLNVRMLKYYEVMGVAKYD